MIPVAYLAECRMIPKSLETHQVATGHTFPPQGQDPPVLGAKFYPPCKPGLHLLLSTKHSLIMGKVRNGSLGGLSISITPGEDMVHGSWHHKLLHWVTPTFVTTLFDPDKYSWNIVLTGSSESSTHILYVSEVMQCAHNACQCLRRGLEHSNP